MLPVRARGAIPAGRSARPGAGAAVHPAASIAHSGALAARSLARLSTAPWRRAGISGGIPVFQPPAPLCMGFIANLSRHPHPR